MSHLLTHSSHRRSLLSNLLITFILLSLSSLLSAAGNCEKEHNQIIKALFFTDYDDVDKLTLDKLADKVILKNSPTMYATGEYKTFEVEKFEGKDAVLDFWRTWRKHVLVTSYRAIVSVPKQGGNERFELARVGLSLNRYHWIQDLMCHMTFNGICEVVDWELNYDPTFLLIASKNNDNVAMPQSASVEPSIITEPVGGITTEKSQVLTEKYLAFLNGTFPREDSGQTLFDSTCIVTFPGDVRTASMIDVCGAFRGTKSLKKFHEAYFSKIVVNSYTLNWKIVQVGQAFAMLHAVENGRFDGRRFSNLDHYILLQTDELTAGQPRITGVNHILNPVVLSGDIRYQSPTKGVGLIMQLILACLVVILSVTVVLMTLYIVMSNAEHRLNKQRLRQKGASRTLSGTGSRTTSRRGRPVSRTIPEEMQPLRLSSDNDEDDEYTDASRVAQELDSLAWVEPGDTNDGPTSEGYNRV